MIPIFYCESFMSHCKSQSCYLQWGGRTILSGWFKWHLSVIWHKAVIATNAMVPSIRIRATKICHNWNVLFDIYVYIYIYIYIYKEIVIKIPSEREKTVSLIFFKFIFSYTFMELGLRFYSYSSLNGWGMVTHLCVSKPVHHRLRQWFVACSAPSHYLNPYWPIVSWTLRSKSSGIWITIPMLPFKKTFWKCRLRNAPILFMHQHVIMYQQEREMFWQDGIQKQTHLYPDVRHVSLAWIVLFAVCIQAKNK